jgi:hypothetical protein
MLPRTAAAVVDAVRASLARQRPLLPAGFRASVLPVRRLQSSTRACAPATGSSAGRTAASALRRRGRRRSAAASGAADDVAPRASSRQRVPPRAAGPATSAAAADDDDDEWELDDSPGLDDVAAAGDDDSGNGDDEADADPAASAHASPREQADMAQRMLAISPPALARVDPLALLATDYTPLAHRVRWLALDDVGMVAPVPSDWHVYSGAGRLLGIPLRTHVAAWPGGVPGAAKPPTAAAAPARRRRGGGGTTAAAAAAEADDADDEDGDDDDTNEAAGGAPLLTGDTPEGPEAHAVGLTVTAYRGAFGSPLLAGAHGSPRDVASFFTQLHMMRRAPEGLVRKGDFLHADADADGERNGSGSGGGHTVSQLRAALDGASGDDVFGSGGGGSSGASASSSRQRRPTILSTWAHAVTRGEVMPGMLDGGDSDAGSSDSDAPQSTHGTAPAARRRAGSVTVKVPTALGPQAVFGALAGGGAGASKSSGSGNSAGPVTMHAPRTAALGPADPLHVYGLEYEVAGAGASAGSASNDDGGSARSASASGSSRGAMRYSVSLILDPASDSVTEVTFAAPADAWLPLWAGEREAPSEAALAARVGLATVAGRSLLDSATLVGVPAYDPHWAPRTGGFDGGAGRDDDDDASSGDD